MTAARRPGRLVLAVGLLLTATGISAKQVQWPSGEPSEAMIVVALADKPDPAMAAGGTPRGYGALPSYAGSQRAASASARLATDFQLREVSAWTIEPLRLRCMVYALGDPAKRDDIVAALRQDRRVKLVQPLQEFETFASPSPQTEPASAAVRPRYNDPYLGLQHSFAAIEAADAQRWARGKGVTVAVIDTGVDPRHPDLEGRIVASKDFVAQTASPAATDRHGTEVAGVISAVADNEVGIVGVAPEARLFSYRACWPVASQASAARCNSYTLALALGAAIHSDARIINLSLGGPKDPLLEELVRYAIDHGKVVVGAVPPSRNMTGFPVGIDGVIAVDTGEAGPAAPDVLAAPGKDILTLEPGGHFDYASGSSLSAAHVSGAAALLLSLHPRLDAAQLRQLLLRSRRDAGASIDVCAAMAELQRAVPGDRNVPQGSPACGHSTDG
ncbi:S8 family peptidase [Tahibacter amnicola]|uniref:S8 family serine peptidase n=1 Tax=Tahibacter amnicola TaxID=2976241 RepID=A0ABY6B8X7_9GAMM|nr:S8 family serine peptidase [Tahibacter amnicola]UXI66516.1 S8 family serine peptidase [Tahibacter amnicola]